MNVLLSAFLSISLLYSASAQAGNTSQVLSDAHFHMASCLKHFQEHIQENINQLQADHSRTLKLELDIDDSLSHQFVLFTALSKAYDYFATSTYDWEHPLREKTLVGKFRAANGRIKFLEERLYQLNELQKMHPRIADRIDALLERLSSNQKTSFQEWMGARGALRNHEQAYYDFLGDQTRWRVYEQGLANNVEWNKTMGAIQEDFYRNLSCVTALDQVKNLIPKSLMEENTNQLAEQPAAHEISRSLSSQLSIDDLE
jgi:hypothetical protein